MKEANQSFQFGLPPKHGLYDPHFEHDACGAGFVVNFRGDTSHEIVDQALTILENLAHRGACGCEANSGDGAGILSRSRMNLWCENVQLAGFELPGTRYYGVGMLFLPTDAEARKKFEQIFEKIVEEEGQTVLGWRDVPTDATLGATAQAAQPVVRQVFIERMP